MFQDVIAALQNRQWGNKIKDANGANHDTGVQEFVETLCSALQSMSESPINLSQPLTFNNFTGGPAIFINQNGGDARAIETRLPDGTFSSYGVGLGNQGVVANELIPMLCWALPPEQTDQLQSQGKGGGSVLEDPGVGFEFQFPKNTGVHGGTLGLERWRREHNPDGQLLRDRKAVLRSGRGDVRGHRGRAALLPQRVFPVAE